MFVSCTRPTIRKRCDSKYYLGDLQRLFFFGYRQSWPEVPILFQNLRSELVYTFKWTKSVARLWRNQICEWTLKKTTYLLTHRWNGGSGVGNEHIFKGGLCILSWLQLLCQSPLPYNADYLQERSDLQKETRRLQFCFGVNFIGILWTEANKYFKVNFIHFMYKHVIITKH